MSAVLEEHMVKASGQIEKELGLLQQRTEDMAIALDPIYDGYLDALAEAGKQQLMSAVYHLCTQAYPDKFLKLSWQARSELQKTLQTIAAQIRPQLKEQRMRAQKMSRRPQRNSGLDFLQRLLESRGSSTIIHAREGSGEDLLEKLSALTQSDHSSDRSLDPHAETEQRSSKHHKSSDDSSDLETTDSIEDWEENLPTAEEYSDQDSDTDESLFLQARQSEGHASKDGSFSAVGLENMDFPESVEDSEEESNALEDELDDELDRDLDDDDLDDDDLDFDDVPTAEQRLTLSEEEDLLSALEGLARQSATAEESDDNIEQPLAPIHLFKQQMLMDKGIRDIFKAISDEVNELLQSANVMPSFPKALMAAATDPQGIGEPVNAVPNVVRVSVRVMHGQVKADPEEGRDGRSALSESRRDRRRRPSRRGSSRPRSGRANPNRREVPHDILEIEALPELALISLQLSEVTFSDPTVSAWRTRLRKELSTLKRLGNRYTKTQRSLETAQAEDAWRSSWMSPDRE